MTDSLGHADCSGAWQGGLSNDELLTTFKAKLPNVDPTDRDLTMFALGVEVGADDMDTFPARVLALCKARGWNLHWTHRGAYLHLEASELIEALRGKRGDPTAEAADVLIVLMSITEANGIAWADVTAQAVKTIERLESAPRYAGEEFSTDAGAQEGGQG